MKFKVRNYALISLMTFLVIDFPLTSAEAFTATTTFNISLTIATSCAVITTPLSFGTYAGNQADASTTLNVICTNTTPYYVNLDNGQQSSCCWSNNMKNSSGAKLNYTLYQDAARTKVWQNTVNYDGEAGTGNQNNQTLTVYGRTPGGQFVAPGAYGDTVIVTVTY